MPDRCQSRSPGYYRVAGLDLDQEMRRLAVLPALGGPHGPLAERPAALAVRRAAKPPRSRFGFAVPSQWRISVTAYPGIRRGDVEETLLHELVHLVVGSSPGQRRWHGREFKQTLARAMHEGYGLKVVAPRGSYHGYYAQALEEHRTRPRRRGVHPQQLALVATDLSGH